MKSDCNGIWTLKHLVHKGTLNHLAIYLVTVTWTSDIASLLSKEFLDSQATAECRFTLKHVCDMIRTDNHTREYFENFILS